MIYIDADGCPVVDLTIQVATENNIPCTIVCDDCHHFSRKGATTITVPQGTDSADFKIISLVKKGDVVITQDYGLASFCLIKKAKILHHNGWQYTDYNIDSLLLERDNFRKIKAKGGRMKGPKKRTNQDDVKFSEELTRVLKDETR